MTPLLSPFPYFGGKRTIAADVWVRLGSPSQYIEPFCGSAAVLLACPHPAALEVVCDGSGFIANFWRAVKQQRAADPQWRSPLARSRAATDVVLEAFRAGRPGKVWSFVQLAAVTGLTLKTVSSAVGHLRRQGYVAVEAISFGRGGAGRQLRAWLVS